MLDKNTLSKTAKVLMLLAISLFSANAFAEIDACNDKMGHPGNGTNVSGNKIGSISGTPWGFEQWYQGDNATMTYYSNGTFKANWSNSSDYLTRVGFQYGDNGPGVDHNTKSYAVDYRYTKTGSAQYGYIGVYGWTVNPQVEYYIVDDWYSRPNEQYVGEKFGEITVDGAKYTIHAFLRQQEPSKTGTSTFLQIFSIRETPRQCGHIDISAHFKKWDELFTGQTKQLRGSKGGGSTQLKFGKVTEVMLMTEAGGGATGSVDYTYFNMVDNASSSGDTPKSSSSVAKSSSSEVKSSSSVESPKSSSSEEEPSSLVNGIDACKEQMEHDGDGTKVLGQNKERVMGDVGSTPYHYEYNYWRGDKSTVDGDNYMVFYDNGTFEAFWNEPNDVLAHVGFKYNEDKTYDEVGPIDAYFNWSKQGGAGYYSFIGIHGWTVDPLAEYYIVDDWWSKPSEGLLGQKMGAITVDGDTYDIYKNTLYNKPYIIDNSPTVALYQYYSVRKKARQCGHIDVTAHFKKWEELGMKMGKMYEAKLLVEAGGGSGSLDVTYFKMTDAEHPLPVPEESSSSEAESSSSVELPKSSSSEVESSSSVELPKSSSSAAESSSSVELPKSSSSEVESSSSVEMPKSSSSEAESSSSEEEHTTVVGALLNGLTQISGSLQVFDMQGRYLGSVALSLGADIQQVLYDKIRKSGVYLIKRGDRVSKFCINP